MLDAHAQTLAQARACLAGLADGASDLVTSSRYERILILLDALYHDDAPAIGNNASTAERLTLATVTRSAIAEIPAHGVDELQIELLLAMLDSAWDSESS